MTNIAQFRPPQLVQEDTVLAESLRARDPEALRALYERFGPLVFAVCRRILGDRERAEDATQQTFLNAWNGADSFEPGRDFAPWLVTIARRAAIDVARRDARRPSSPVGVGEELEPSPEEPDASLVERVWSVRAAIDRLEPTDRELVRLQHLSGFTHQEIAHRLELPIGTVKSRSFRAHRRLAQQLAHLRADDAAPPSDDDEQTRGAAS